MIHKSFCNDHEIRIYVACLAAYNNGTLHGSWIDANQEADAICGEIRAMLAASPEPGAEEWAIHDYEGFFGLQLSEYEGVESVARIAEAIAEHGEPWALYAVHTDTDYAFEHFEEAYVGAYKDELDFATELFDDLYLSDIPENIRFYVDYDAFARDIFIGDYVSSVGHDHMVHVFDRHV